MSYCYCRVGKRNLCLLHVLPHFIRFVLCYRTVVCPDFITTTSGQTWHKAASLPHTDGSVVFVVCRQCAPYIQKAKNGCHGNVSQYRLTPSNTWFLRPIRANNPNGISISAAVFAGLTCVTHRPTDHGTRSVTIGNIYVRSTAMRPNNNNTHANIYGTVVMTLVNVRVHLVHLINADSLCCQYQWN